MFLSLAVLFEVSVSVSFVRVRIHGSSVCVNSRYLRGGGNPPESVNAPES